MLTPYQQAELANESQTNLPVWPLAAVLLGSGLGFGLHWLWPGFSGLAAWAVWLISVALGLLVVTVIAARWSDELRWDMLIAGKLLGVLGALMMFGASLL